MVWLDPDTATNDGSSGDDAMSMMYVPRASPSRSSQREVETQTQIKEDRFVRIQWHEQLGIVREGDLCVLCWGNRGLVVLIIVSLLWLSVMQLLLRSSFLIVLFYVFVLRVHWFR